MLPFASLDEAAAALGRNLTAAEAAWFRYSAGMPNFWLYAHNMILLLVVYTLFPLPVVLAELRRPKAIHRYKLQPKVRVPATDIFSCYKSVVRIFLFVVGPLYLFSFHTVMWVGIRTGLPMPFRQHWNNMQFVTGAAFLLTVYSDYLSSAGRNMACSAATASPAMLLNFTKSQVDYALGDNPRGISYMVDYSDAYTQQVHHRASSIVSIKVSPAFVSCSEGYSKWYGRKGSDPNILDGAVVGGPDAYDNFVDRSRGQPRHGTTREELITGTLQSLLTALTDKPEETVTINFNPGSQHFKIRAEIRF